MLVAYFDFCSNVPLNNTYKNAVHFTTNEERIAFFQNYIKISTGSNVQYNFNFKPNPNSLTTTLVINFEGSPFTKRTIYNINYILVHQNFDNETEPTEGYYFVTGVRCIRKDVVEFSLELDVMSTYPYKLAWDTRNKVFVERKHCNRFSPFTGTNAIFNGEYANNGDELDTIFKAQYPTEPFYFEQNKNPYDEDEQISENLTRSEVYELISKYQWEMLITTEAINNNLNYFALPTAISGTTITLTNLSVPTIKFETTKLFNSKNELDSGVYVYIYPKYSENTHQLKMYQLYNDIENIKPITMGFERMGFTYPIFMKEPQLEAVSTTVNRLQIPINFVYSLIGRYARKGTISVPNFVGGVDYGMRLVNDFIYFEMYPYTRDVNKINILPSSQENDDYVYIDDTYFGDDHRIQTQIFLRDIDYANDKVWTFENSFFSFYNYIRIQDRNVNNLKNMRLEPKMYKPPYSRFIMNSLISTNEGFEINPLLLNNNKCNIITKFTPTPSLTRFSYFIKPIVGETPYNYMEDLNIGVISTMDYSLPIKIDRYAEYVTEKRNFAISGLATPVASSLGVSAGILGATAQYNPSAFFSSLGGASIGIASAFTSAMNYATTVDNLINAPDSVKNTGNDALSDFGLNVPLLPYIVKYEMTEAQKRQVFDYYYMFGYKVSSFFDMEECFGRQRFNYIKTLDDELYEKITTNDSLSNEVRVKIQDIFNKGVTMWEPSYAVEMSIEFENLEK